MAVGERVRVAVVMRFIKIMLVCALISCAAVTALPIPAQARYVRSRKGGYKWIRGDRRRRRFPQNRRRRSRRRRFGVTSALTTAESR